MKKTKFRGLTDRKLLDILVSHEEAVNRQGALLAWLFRATGYTLRQAVDEMIAAEQAKAAAPVVTEGVVTDSVTGQTANYIDEVAPIPESVWADLGRPEGD